jgi:hypothetical protein
MVRPNSGRMTGKPEVVPETEQTGPYGKFMRQVLASFDSLRICLFFVVPARRAVVHYAEWSTTCKNVSASSLECVATVTLYSVCDSVLISD